MSASRASRAARRRRRRPALRVALGVVVLGALLAIGIALGQALSSNPEPGPAVTRERTVVPVAATRETVTVTTTVATP